MVAMDLTAQMARERLCYDPETGLITWRTTRHAAAVGCEAGYTCRSTGYRKVMLDGRLYIGHRIAWLLHFGEWPKQAIDHIDGNRLNNRITNLRDVTLSMNQQNKRSAQSNSSTGMLGVSVDKLRFRANIMVNGKQRSLGSFATPELAHAAYVTAKRQFHTGNTL